MTERDLGRPEPVVAPAGGGPGAAFRYDTVAIIRNMKREEYTVMRSN